MTCAASNVKPDFVGTNKNTRLQSRKRVDNHIKSGYNVNRKGATDKDGQPLK